MEVEMRRLAASISALLLMLVIGSPQIIAQVNPAGAAAGQSAQTPLPPATKLEAFKPAAGSVVTIGYDELGGLAGISVDVREMRDAKGAGARGLLVEVTESQYRKERSFVDADEIPELLKGFDALLDVKENPTPFKSFEVRYTTRGELQLTAFNTSNNAILYAIQVGRGLKAQRIGISAADMQKLRATFEAGLQKIGTLLPPVK